MRRSWRLTAIGMLVVGMMLALGTGPSAAQSRAHVYLLRGLMNIFSLGMDTLSSSAEPEWRLRYGARLWRVAVARRSSGGRF